MTNEISIRSGGLSLVDPSVDPQIILDTLGNLVEIYGYYSAIKAALETFRRLPSVEYAVGFDGVDDYISVPNLEVEDQGLELEANIWISQDNEGSRLLTLVDDSDETVFTLVFTDDENPRIKAYYKNGADLENVPINGIELEKWQKLRIWSDGQTLSIEIDGKETSSINDIDLDNPSFKLYFGRGRHHRNFRGMVRHMNVNSSIGEIFSVQSGKNVSVQDETNSVVAAGIHNMKKGRFEKEFS